MDVAILDITQFPIEKKGWNKFAKRRAKKREQKEKESKTTEAMHLVRDKVVQCST